MSEVRGQIAFSQVGLGALLKQHRLVVPPNQREYAWTEKEVTTLLQDFAKAIADGGRDYFLGTIVTIPRSLNELEVVDGQQRLATTAILLAAIRDHLKTKGETVIVEDIDNTMLTDTDRRRRQRVPRLRLNLDDNEFFRSLITGKTPDDPRKPSHKLMAKAFTEARDQVRRVVSTVDEKDHGDVLNNWLEFIEHSAQVILLKVPTDVNAYTMFETLNDRGLKTSQADLVKNYLFGQAADRLQEAQQKWTLMRGALDSLDEDDITGYLRSALMLMEGYLREPEVYEKVQRQAKGPQQTIIFLTAVANLANSYVALFNPDHEKWNPYPTSINRALATLNLLSVKLMRPLMLAVAIKFNAKEAASAFEKFVAWETRFLIAGNTRTGGAIELPIAHAARRVYTGEITSAKALAAELSGAIPSNEEFRRQFEVARVSKATLARYYLRSLERQAKEEPAPWYIPNDDREAINLEHVLPKNPEANWPAFDEETTGQYSTRLGNLVLLKASQNSDLKSGAFAQKKKAYADSPYALTRHVATVDQWTPKEIDERQKTLAEMAVKTWPL